MVLTDKGVTLTCSSELVLVDFFSHVLTDLLAYMRLGDGGATPIVARELMRNAVIHGNAGDKRRSVVFSLDWSNGACFAITVCDEGGGFDYGMLEAAEELDARHAQRKGYALIYECAQSVDFERNGATVRVSLARVPDCRGEG